MEFLMYSAETQEKSERLIVFLFSLYSIGMSILSRTENLKHWVSIFIIVTMVVGWGIYVFRVRNYPFRAMVISILLHISMVIYACHVENLFPFFSVILSVGIIMGLYAISELMWINISATIFLIFYHVATNTIEFGELVSSGSSILLIFSVFLAQYMIYFWVKKRIERTQEFLRLSRALKDAERSKNDFLSNVSHEIRTPVNTICGMSELVLEDDDPKKTKEAMFDIQTAGRNLLTVVSDVLDFSELQSDKIELEEEEYNISSTINDIINMSMAQKSQKKLELIVDCNAALPSGLLGDEKKIRRVVMNVVNNAIKFTNEGGVSITIDFRRESYGINLIITVKDTGIGMQDENLEKLFTSFNQVDTKRNRQEGGIGLGLAISRALVEKMGGVISIRSTMGKGTSVKIVVPQKVVDDRPIAHLEKKDNLSMLTYIDMEQFNMRSIRDAYATNVIHMAMALQVQGQNCRNLAELKRKEEKEKFTHIFTGIGEYLQEPEYFNGLAKKVNLIVILDREDASKVTSDSIIRLYKPFYILSILQVLNNTNEKNEQESVKMVHQRKFIAPDTKVLVVDDNEMNIRVIEGLLKCYQIKVTRAMSGQEALNLIESRDYDFVFMDHMMPEMDGVETFHRIRNKRELYFREVPIIALTADALAGSRERMLEEGFNDFLEKPVDLSVLERVLLRTIAPIKIQYIDDIQEKTEKEEDKKENREEKQTQESTKEDGFTMGDLDVEKGFSYCGGEDKYLETLAENYVIFERERTKIEKCYEAAEWKNYTIAVHALKSAMLCIGAVKLSEQAKALEMAGRGDDIEFIKGHHDEMLEEWKRVMEMIGADARIPIEEAKRQLGMVEESVEERVEEKEKENADDMMMNHWMEEIEDATFTLDGEKMLSVLKEMQNYSYLGNSMEEPLKEVIRKVEMSDLMSAFDMVSDLSEKWKMGGDC